MINLLIFTILMLLNIDYLFAQSFTRPYLLTFNNYYIAIIFIIIILLIRNYYTKKITKHVEEIKFKDNIINSIEYCNFSYFVIDYNDNQQIQMSSKFISLLNLSEYKNTLNDIIDWFDNTNDSEIKDIPPITFNVTNEKLTLIYFSHTLSRKDTFNIDPNKTVLYLKEAIKDHYKITIPKEFGEKIKERVANISSILSADHHFLFEEYQSLKEAGLKPYDIIEFEYQLDEY